MLLEPGATQRALHEPCPPEIDKAKHFRLGQHCRETGMEELTEEVIFLLPTGCTELIVANIKIVREMRKILNLVILRLLAA